ncbi:T9SS type A sorting domain-containing protein [Flavobacterium sp.]|uniref:T9SS type A sorting domain-containing protein n=1 Tax=Flavobacterium sp. TaxID=239 RepID=UPI0038FC43D1
MKKFYLIALFALVCNFASAQIESVSYRGAFAPAPAAMWTDSWTEWDPKNAVYTDAATVVNVTTDITVNTTWVVGTTYKISGLIYVRNGATLTIQPGVTVKGVFTSTGTALIITKGAKLNAIGTAALPIVFTSDKAAGLRSPGDWGGIVLLGKARVSALTTANTGLNNIEGITASVNTEYGGGLTPNDADNSGTLKYVRIEFGGFVFSNNNEINGLTMGGVGSGTTIDYVQTSYTNDDSFEWFGGAVNCKHLVAYRGLDDDFDTDNGYKGFVQFALGIKDPAIADNPVVSNSEGFESDNNPAGVTVQAGWDDTKCIFSNCTLIGPSGRVGQSVAGGHERPLRLRRASQIKVYNSIFLDFKSNYLFVDGSTAQANANANTLKFQNNIIAGAPSSTYTFGVRGSSSTTTTSATELSSWFSTNNNSYLASAGILTAPYNTANYSDYNANTTTIDYRPGTVASTGALFTDASIATLVGAVGTGDKPTTANLTYCKGTLGLSPLTAILSATGVSLKWYTVAIKGTALTTAPTPSTTVVGTKTYYVSELSAGGAESARTSLDVLILAAPTVGLGAIKGINALTAAVTAVGLSIGTSTEFTYSVVSPSVDTSITSYLWTVPAGVNIKAGTPFVPAVEASLPGVEPVVTAVPAVLATGQGTNTITVNYLNVPAGAGFVGTITAQGVNANACPGVASKLVIKKALATAPTLKMYDKNSAKPITPLTSFGQFAGTETPVTLVSSTVATATGYKWELPAGVSLVTGTTTPVTTTVTFTAEPFLAPTTAPTTVGTKFWVVTYNTYTGVNVNSATTKIVTSTAVQRIAGTTQVPVLYTFSVTAGSTAAVGNTFTYDGNTYTVRTALTTVATSLVCTGAGTTLPSASIVGAGTLTKVSDSSTIAFSAITRTSAVTGYGATTSAPYVQYGTVITSDLPSIIVSFAGATANTVNELYLGVKSLNGVGASVTNNNTLANATAIANNVPGINYNLYTEVITPAVFPSTNATSTYIPATPGTTPSTATLLKVVSVVPLAPASIKSLNVLTSVTNISTYVGTTKTLTLTAAAVANASSYTWTLPLGVNVKAGATQVGSATSPSTWTSTSNSITVDYDGIEQNIGSVIIAVKAKNNVDSSVDKTLTLTAVAPATPATPTGTLAICPSAATSVTYTIVALATNATSYLIEAPVGATVTTATGFASSVEIDAVANATFTVNYVSGFISTTAAKKYIYIFSKNGFGSSATLRALTLTNATSGCPASPGRIASEAAVANEFSVVAYPNPSSSEFTIETSAKGAINVNVYDMQGRLVEKTTSTQVGSRLAKGVYNVIVSQGANTKSVRVIKK